MVDNGGWRGGGNGSSVGPALVAADGGADQLLEVHRTEVAGVPVFVGQGPGPFVAGLVFRVGRADERAPRGGITHLVEHLALPAGRRQGVEFNGSVSSSTTSFWAAGERDAARDLLRDTTRSVRELPARLETERAILLTEASARPGRATWLGFVAGKRARESGEASTVANIGTLMSLFGLLFWLGLSVVALATGW